MKQQDIDNLIVGQWYNVSYMPTKYLYRRVGKLLLKNNSHLKFGMEDDEHFFPVQPKHVKSITLIQP